MELAYRLGGPPMTWARMWGGVGLDLGRVKRAAGGGMDMGLVLGDEFIKETQLQVLVGDGV